MSICSRRIGKFLGRLWIPAVTVARLVSPATVHAADVKLAWDANSEPNLAGYKVYYGQASSVYGAPIDVGNSTSYTITGLAPGKYYFAVTAYNTGGLESAYSNEVSATLPSAGPGALTLAITSPTAAGTFTTNTSPLSLGGTASDNVAITQVTWTNSAGGSGIAAGTTSWTTNVPLQNGPNTITITATDQAGNSASASITITYTQGITGDINRDRRVDALDLQILSNAILGIPQTGNCDLNGDGKVDVLDLQILTNIIMGVSTKP